MDRKRLFALSLICFAVLSWWLTSINTSRHDTHLPSAQNVAEFFMDDFRSIQMDENGQPRHIIYAEHMVRYSNTDTTDITAPQIALHRGQQKQWHISAQQGILNSKDNIAEFNGNVVIQGPQNNQHPLNIYTASLALYADKQYAESTDNVVMQTPNAIIKANGLRAYFDSDKIVLSPKVRGQYVP